MTNLTDEFVDLMKGVQLQVSLVVHLLFNVLKSLSTASLLCTGQLLGEVKVHTKLLQPFLLFIKLLFLVVCVCVSVYVCVCVCVGGRREGEMHTRWSSFIPCALSSLLRWDSCDRVAALEVELFLCLCYRGCVGEEEINL